MSKNKTIFSAPGGEEIKCRIRFGSLLVIETNFDAMRHIDFAENHVSNSAEIDRFSVVNLHGDGSGYYIFHLREGFDREMLLDDISVWFNHYYFDAV